MNDEQLNAALHGLRVLEIGSGVAASFAARLLGDLGADVVKVEAPECGDVARGVGPFVREGDSGTAPASLLFRYLNWNKRSIVLDLTGDQARNALRSLVASVDLVIEDFPPGVLDRLGVGPARMQAWNPRVVVTSISNFGQQGKYAHWEATDLILYAMSGLMSISGKKYPKPPLKHGLRQAYYCAGLNAAYASLAAVHLARSTGTGERVDLSIRECLASELVTSTSYYVFMGAVSGRHPIREDPFSGDPLAAATGYVSLQSNRSAPMTSYATFLDLPELASDAYANSGNRIRNAERLRALTERRLQTEDSVEFFERACKAGLLVGVVQDADYLLACRHLRDRKVFRVVDEAKALDGSPVRYPVELSRLELTPVSVRRAAPILGEHTDEVLAEAEAIVAARGPQSPSGTGARERLPMAGVRVLDLSSIVAGPYMGGLLADMGAEVIKVEGPQRFDPTRGGYGPFFDNDLGTEPWNRGGSYNMLNRGKRSFVCDLTAEKGQSVLRSLLKWADILIENYRPTVLEKWGLSSEELMKTNPRLITMSNSGFGASGPWRNFRAQGTTLELTMGFGAVTGYRNEPPSKAGQSYPDYIACWYGLTAIIAALIWRARTGKGQRIDQGMYQMGVSLLPEAILGRQVDGAQTARLGSADFDALVSDVFESRDQDRWVAVSIRDRADVGRLSAAVPQVASLVPEFDQSNDESIQQVRKGIAEFVRGMKPDEAATILQGAGVPAAPVLDVADLLMDEHLVDRCFYEDVDFGTELGVRPLIGRPFKYSSGKGPTIVRRAADFGADNEYVLSDILGLSQDEIHDLYESGIVADAPTVPHPGKPADMESMVRSGAMARFDKEYREKLRARAAR